jgi:hypothetical protein
LWTYAEETPLLADYRMWVDFYHTCEHLADAAQALWGVGSPPSQAMVLMNTVTNKKRMNYGAVSKACPWAPDRRSGL